MRIDLRRISPVTSIVFAACAAIELTLTAADLGLVEPPRLRQTTYEYAGFWPGLLDDWRPNYPAQPYLMFFTYGFLHGGIVHLGVNMLTLFSLGAAISDRVGEFRYSAIYGASILGGAAGFGLLAPGLVPMVGASGALFGLAGAIIAWEFLDRRRLRVSIAPVWRMVVLLAGLNLVLWWAMDGHLAWETHLGGFLTGLAVAALLDRPEG